ncbi:MAG: sulfur carrier protein ThiS [Lentisphaeria bacterium]
MEIKVNGILRECSNGISIEGLLEELAVNKRSVLVEYNGEVLMCEDYSVTKLSGGDVVEIIEFVAGG